MKQPLLEIVGIEKRYGELPAVNGVSFAIERGTCFGLLGPNGAGKTTLLEIIEGILPASAGEVLYQGFPRPRFFREKVGIQFQQTALLAFLSVKETLRTFQQLYRKTRNLEDLIRECRLQEIAHQYNDRISGGERQRLLLALALVNDPELLFLDEPSTGLDPHARRDLWEIIERQRALGKTLILTTHYMEEAQHLCDAVAIMDHGKIIAMGTPEALISVHCKGAAISLPQNAFPEIPEEFPWPFQKIKERLVIRTESVNACLAALMQGGVRLDEMVIRSPNLEDVFLSLTGRQLRNEK